MIGAPSKIAKAFVTQSASAVLLASVAGTVFFAAALYGAAYIENVLTIDGGVGLLQNKGIYFALSGDALILFFSKKFIDSISELAAKKYILKNTKVQAVSRNTNNMLMLNTWHRLIFYFLSVCGMLFVISNISNHLFGGALQHWGYLVFDSIDHPFSFLMNRIFSIYSWVILFPYCIYASLVSSIQLIRIFRCISRDESIKYDVMDADMDGGFSSVSLAKIYYNASLVIVYLQITIYIDTFNGIHAQHLASYVLASAALLFGNYIFFGKIDGVINKKKIESLNHFKDMAYSGDQVGLEIYKYFTETLSKRQLHARVSKFTFSMRLIAATVLPIFKIASFLYRYT